MPYERYMEAYAQIFLRHRMNKTTEGDTLNIIPSPQPTTVGPLVNSITHNNPLGLAQRVVLQHHVIT